MSSGAVPDSVPDKSHVNMDRLGMPLSQPLEQGPKGELQGREVSAKKESGSSAKILVSFPISMVARTTAILAQKPVVSVVSGLSCVTAGALHYIFKGARHALTAAEKGEVIKHMATAAQEITRETLEATKQTIQERREKAQTVASVGQMGMRVVAAFVPVIAVPVAIADAALEAGKAVEKVERQVEMANISVGEKVVFQTMEGVKRLAPIVLNRVVIPAVQKLENMTGHVKDITYAATVNPSQVSDALMRVADRAEATSHRILHPIQESESFAAIEEEFQMHAKPADEIQLTPEGFHDLDELDKIKIVRLVTDHAKKLSKEDRSTLLQAKYRRLQFRNDWKKLSEAEQEKIEQLIVKKFNTLSKDTRVHFYNLSVEQFRELSEADKKIIFDLAFLNIQEKGTEKEKVRFAALQKKISKENSITQFKDILSILKAFKYASPEQQRRIQDIAKMQIVTFVLTEEQLTAQIQICKAQLAELEKSKTAENEGQRAELAIAVSQFEKAKEQYLKAQAKPLGDATSAEVTRPSQKFDSKKIKHTQPIQTADIQAKVGIEVTTPGKVSTAATLMGYGPALVAQKSSELGAKLFQALSTISSPAWIGRVMNGTASGLEFYLTLPQGRDYLTYRLQEAGIPISKINEIIANVPTATIGMLKSTLGAAGDALIAAGKRIDDAFDYLQKVREAENVGAAWGAATVANKEVEAATLEFVASVKDFCKVVENHKKLICGPEVAAFLQDTTQWKAFAKEHGVEVYSTDFLSLLKKVGEGEIAPPVMQAVESVKEAVSSVSLAAPTLPSAPAAVKEAVKPVLPSSLIPRKETISTVSVFPQADEVVRPPEPLSFNPTFPPVEETIKTAPPVPQVVKMPTEVSVSQGVLAKGVAFGKEAVEPPLPPSVVPPILQIASNETCPAIEETFQHVTQSGKEASALVPKQMQATLWSGVSSTLTGWGNSIAESTPGKIAGYGFQGAKKVASGAAAVAQTAATKAAGTVAAGASAAYHGVMRATGYEENIPQEVLDKFYALVKTTKQLVDARAQLTTCELSKAALGELSGVWAGVMKAAAIRGKPIEDYLRSIWESGAKQNLGYAASALKTLEDAAHINQDILQTQIQSAMAEDPLVIGLLEKKGKAGKVALEHDEDYDASTSAFVLKGLNYGLPALGWMGIRAAGFNPFLLLFQKIVPHALRAAGAKMATGARPFWANLAANARAASETHKTKTAGRVGAWLQETFPIFRSKEIDKQRITNFHALTPKPTPEVPNPKPSKEQEHLFGLVETSGKLKGKELEAYKAMHKDFPGKIDGDRLHKFVIQTLTIYDQLNQYELLNLSPEYILQLDSRTQERIVALVEKHAGVERGEYENPEAIATKFNALPETIKKQIDDLSVLEYSNLTEDEQEDIRFIAAHTDAYKEALLGNLPEVRQEEYLIGFEIKNETWKERLGIRWELEQFREIGQQSNRELQKTLVTYSRLSPEERASILTPSQLRKMGDAKILHVLEILERFHPQYGDELLEATDGKINLHSLKNCLGDQRQYPAVQKQKEKLLEALASLFSKMPPSQRVDILQMIPQECAGFTVSETRPLLGYMVANSALSTAQQEQIKEEIVKLERGDKVDEKLITKLFNQMSLMDRAEVREMISLGLHQTEAVTKSIQKEITDLTMKITHYTNRINSLSDSTFLGLEARIKAAEEVLRPIQERLSTLRGKEGGLIKIIREHEKNPTQKALLQNVHADLERLQKDILAEELMGKKHLKDIAVDREKQNQTAQKIVEIQNLQIAAQDQRRGLQRMLGMSNMPMSELEIEAESLQVQPAIRATIDLAMSMTSNTIREGFIDVLKQKATTEAQLNTMAADYRLVIEKFIEIAEKNVKTLQDQIKTLKHEIRYSDPAKVTPEELVKKRLHLKGGMSLMLPLREKLLENLKNLAQEFEKEVKEQRNLIMKGSVSPQAKGSVSPQASETGKRTQPNY